MVVRLRLARFGRKDRPFYRIVAIDSRKARQGKMIEQVGSYDPLQSRDGSKEVRLKTDRIKYWISEGAQPSETVARLLGMAGVLPAPPIRYQPMKSVPKSEREFHTSARWTARDVAASGASVEVGNGVVLTAGPALRAVATGAAAPGAGVGGARGFALVPSATLA